MPSKRSVPSVNEKLANFKLFVARSKIERFGIFAGETIPKNKRVIEYTGERISQKEGERRAVRRFLSVDPDRIYQVSLNRRWRIDGSIGGSGAEIMNHSCNPNVALRRIRNRIFLYSLRKIRPKEELTWNYGFECSYPCNCGASNCRGTMCRR